MKQNRHSNVTLCLLIALCHTACGVAEGPITFDGPAAAARTPATDVRSSALAGAGNAAVFSDDSSPGGASFVDEASASGAGAGGAGGEGAKD